MGYAFINIFSTKSDALSVRKSVHTHIYNHRGIQLLPEKENEYRKYIQTSDVKEGIVLEDWIVFLVSLCDGTRTEITSSFFIERVFQDNNGVSQIDWSLRDLPEMGTGLLYLEINQWLEPGVFSQTWYTNVFQVTDVGYEATARIDYNDSIYDTMQSIQLQIYWWQDDRNFDISSYNPVSKRGARRTVTSRSNEFEVWCTKVINRNFIISLTRLFDLTYMYVDFERCWPFEPSEIPRLEFDENFKDYTFTLSFDKNDIFDPNYIPPVPELLPSIDFQNIQYIGNNRISLTYQTYNFSPIGLTIQHSMDGVTWTDDTFATLTNFYTLPYPYATLTYLRIVSLLDNVFSNVLTFQTEQPLVISSATAIKNSFGLFIITVNYNTAYFTGQNILISTSGVESLHPNTGTITHNITGTLGQVKVLVLKATDNSFISETKNVTLSL